MEHNITEKHKIILAALLHDIGKFYQRAEENENALSSQSKNMESIICPKNSNNQYSHRHVLWTNEFFENYLKISGDITNYAVYHHKPENKLQKIIQLADWISSGERVESEEVSERESYETPLVSVFSSVNFNSDLPAQNEIYYLPLEKYEFSPEIHITKDLKLTKDDYNKLWKDFIEDVNFLSQNNEIITDYKTWLYLLMKYCTKIPSATPTKVRRYFPDISLFDHLKTTSAIAVCLYENNIDEKDLDKIITCFGTNDEILNQKYFAVIKGDISGIQKFVYTITSKGAASTLKGRSFFLQLLSEILAKKVLDELDLPETNLLYNGGGHFYILAPNIQVKEKLEKIENDVEQILFNYFQGKLGVLIDFEELGINDFCNLGQENAFSFAWERVSKKVNLRKNTKFIKLLKNVNNYEKIWNPIGNGGKVAQCKVCRVELETTDNEEVCSLCSSFENLGKTLRNAEYILIRGRKDSNSKIKEKKWFSILSHLGYDVFLYSSNENEEIKKQHYDEIILLNSTNFKEKLKDKGFLIPQMGRSISVKFRQFGINTPVKENEVIKTFEDLGKSSDNKIGVMRADVDDLSRIFQKGLGSKATISRMSTLSNSLQYFFESWLSKFLETKYKNDIYLIYSGGDDMLLVGSWNKIIDAAYEIRTSFQKYTANNKYFGISCGISITDDKFPIYRSAELSGKAEKESKNYSRKSKTKDAVTIFDVTVGWEEYENFNLIWNKLEQGIKIGKNNKKMPQAILRKLFMISYLYEREKEYLKKTITSDAEIKKLVQYTKWRWYLIYTIARSKDPTFKSDLEEIQKMVLDEEITRRLKLPLRLAELSLRIK